MTDRETDRQTDNRQSDRQTGRQTDSRDYCVKISFLVLISRSLALKVFIISWRKKKENWRGSLIRLTSLTTLNSSLDLFNLKNPDQAHLKTTKLSHNRYKSIRLLSDLDFIPSFFLSLARAIARSFLVSSFVRSCVRLFLRSVAGSLVQSLSMHANVECACLPL